MIPDLDAWLANAPPRVTPAIPPLPPPRRPLPLPDRDGRRAADPSELTACHLEDWGAAWAKALRIPVARFARRDGEDDAQYRPRLIAAIEHFVGRLQ